ncbi:ABC-2 type transport system permease protein [Sanguibacter gelidistatuariae]|uniref:Transport permease protein n=1 Tax=Sanguibacter gelidistatuariae TaxID=1814289 RepID=A0A1G6XWH0_9MICO|nr:ABC transporter permease [Sanguibacter gelidistatuariae]SDD81716.1 ABC-2 type transport system permease protein [Sanguibacter gelidistatuariae]
MTSTQQDRAVALAEQPLRTAGPRLGFASGTWSSIKDIFDQRELLDMLIRRELKARYKDSALGFVWTLIRPLAMLLIYYVALGKFMGAARQTPEFAIFIYAGLTAWGFYSEALSAGTGSVVANSGLVKKVYLPREIFPLSAIGSALFNFAIQLVILVLATVAMGSFPTGSRWGYFIGATLILVLYGTAMALLLSAWNVYLRDIQYLVEIFVMIFFWVSPIVYPWAMFIDNVKSTLIQEVYLANPITLAVLGFQRTFWTAGDAKPVPDHLYFRMGIAILIGIVLLWLCQRVFARLQANFAQEL